MQFSTGLRKTCIDGFLPMAQLPRKSGKDRGLLGFAGEVIWQQQLWKTYRVRLYSGR
jgi:hypothetical protein